MTEKTIQSIPVMPFALMLACINAVIGLIIGIFYVLFFGTIYSMIPSTASTAIGLALFRFIFGLAALIIMPVIGFIGGLIQGALCAALYNFLAPRIGGIKVRFKEEQQPS